MYVFRWYRKLVGSLVHKRWPVVLLLLLAVFFNFFLFPLFSRDDPGLLDTRFAYTPSDVEQYLNQLSSEQKAGSIITHATLDVVYPVIYTLLLSSLLYLVGGGRKKKLLLFPLSVLVLDILENGGIVVLLLSRTPGGIMYSVISFVLPYLTTGKWLCAAFSALLILVLALVTAAGRIKGSRGQ